MKSHARAVVIGGGVVGCSILYHLTKKGWKDVVLLERSELTAGSSWHAAGGVHTLNSDPVIAKLQKYTVQLYKEIEEISGQDCGVHITGGVMLAGTKERMDFIKTAVAKRRHLGLDSEVLTAEEASEFCPIMNTDYFLGALYEPYEGHLDPSGVTHAYAKAARIQGAEIYRHTKVEDMHQDRDGMWNIITNQGNIQCEHVINAGGLWARELGRMVGLELPLLPMEHHYLITEDIPEIAQHKQVHAIDFEGEIYLRKEGKGLLLGTYEKACVPWSRHETPWDFGFELLPSDLERIAPSLEVGFKHFPCLENAGIKKIINGPFTFAPDCNPLVGPIEGLPNYWSACAVVAGFSQGGGIGLVLSNWIVDNDPGYNIAAMDISRFGAWANKAYTYAKAQEGYTRRFSISFPNEELPIGRPLRTTPIYQKLKEYNAVFGSSYGLEHALWFAPQGEPAYEIPSFKRSNGFDVIGDEALNVRENLGLFEISSFAKYKITGQNAAAWLNHLLAGRIPSAGRMALSPMLNHRGQVIGDFTVAYYKDGFDHNVFYLFGSGPAEGYHMRWFKSQINQEDDIRIEPLGLQLCGLSLAGPNARRLLEKLTYSKVDDASFSFMDFKELEIGMIKALVGRISFTGDLGYEIWVSADYHLALFTLLMNEGKDLGIRLFGSRALNALRLEKSFGGWGREYTPDYNAHECGLARFIQKSKPDFIGKQAFIDQAFDRKAEAKVSHMTLTSFRLDLKDADPIADEPISYQGKVIGWVTSGGYGYAAKKSIALGYIPHELVADGREFSIEILGEHHRAILSTSSLFDPDGLRMRG